MKALIIGFLVGLLAMLGFLAVQGEAAPRGPEQVYPGVSTVECQGVKVTGDWYARFYVCRTLDRLAGITLADVVRANTDEIQGSLWMLPYSYAVPQERKVVLSRRWTWYGPQEQDEVLMHEVGHLLTWNVLTERGVVPCTYGTLGESRAQVLGWTVAYTGMNEVYKRTFDEIPDTGPLYAPVATEAGCQH